MTITSVDIDDKLYDEMKKIISMDSVEYPSMSNFINKAIKEKIKNDTKTTN
jgi:metal-responsive CopG/Arc/MetJ family transcriptional regulator